MNGMPIRPKRGSLTAGLALRITPDLKARIDRAAEDEGRTISQWVLQVIHAALEVHEAAKTPPASPKKKAAAR